MRVLAQLLAVGLATWGVAVELFAGPGSARPVVVRFHEPKREGTPAVAALSPHVHVKIQHMGRMMFGLQVDDVMLATGNSGIRTTLRVDDQVLSPASGPAGPLPAGPQGKRRSGGQSTWLFNNLQFTQVIEVVPTKAPPGEPRPQDAVLIQYLIENKTATPHQVGVRVRIDSNCNGNDAALFASPTTHPGKVLDGIELRGKSLPDYVQILERPDLRAPGFVGHFALRFGARLTGPDRFVCTSHQALDNGWNLAVQPANGDSDCALYWEPRLVPAGGQLALGFAYGKGLPALEGEGRLTLKLSGSFEPNRSFTLAAYVDEPLANQVLCVETSPDLELLEGRAIEPVPRPAAASGTSLVLWKGRVRSLGTHSVTVRSSTGVAETQSFTVSR